MRAREFDRGAAYLDEADAELAPASPAISAFMRELLARYPALGDQGDQGSPWATGPGPGDINGNFAYLTMTYPGALAAYEFITEVARGLGLVCFDPQNNALVGSD